MAKTFLKVLICFFVLNLITACSFTTSMPYPPLGDKIESLEKKAEYFGKIYKNQKEYKNARILNEVRVVQNGEVYQFRYLFVFDNDGNLRIEAFPPTTFMSIHILTQNKDGAVFLDRQQEQAIKSKSANDILKKVWGENLNYKTLMNSFIGNSNLKTVKDYDFYLITKNFGSMKNIKVLQLIDKKSGDYFEYFADDLTLLGYEFWGNKDEDLLVRIKRDEQFVLLILPENDLVMNFKIIKKEIDSTVNNSIFKVKIPKNYKENEI